MKTMDHPTNDSSMGKIYLTICLFAQVIKGLMNWFAEHSLQEILSPVATFVSIVAGVMAIRYYFFATKKLKK